MKQCMLPIAMNRIRIPRVQSLLPNMIFNERAFQNQTGTKENTMQLFAEMHEKVNISLLLQKKDKISHVDSRR